MAKRKIELPIIESVTYYHDISNKTIKEIESYHQRLNVEIIVEDGRAFLRSDADKGLILYLITMEMVKEEREKRNKLN